MADLNHPLVLDLLAQPNHAVISTLQPDGAVLSNVVWIDLVDGVLAVNSAAGRRWPRNLERDPRITVVVYNETNPLEYVEVRGTASFVYEGAYAHIEAMARKYMGVDEYPYQRPGEIRIKHIITAHRVRAVKAA